MATRRTIAAAGARARAYLLLVAALGQRGLVGADEQESWEKRSAWTRGIEHGRLYLLDALKLASATPDALPEYMQAALRVLDEFAANQPNTLRPIPPERIAVVSAAAQLIADGMRNAFNSLPPPE